ncbi:MAG: DUF4194 domain-containing protein [Lachnospiraceae bacterium]|nr:DUF4194 domain-containing protein [Lachnospiraceae bacterium]
MQEYWDSYTSSEKEQFQRICRRLLKQTFIVRDKDEESKRAYFFISKRPEPFSRYFGYIGFDVMVDRDNGVAMLCNCADVSENGRIQTNHLVLKKAESLVLCALWTLYVDRIRAGSLARSIVVSVVDLKYELEKYGLKDPIDKTSMIQILALFERFCLIDVQGNVGEAECLIRLYPSLQFVLEGNEFVRFVDNANRRMKDKRGQEYQEEDDGAEENDESDE